ncbi:HD-GYP domain-containing protein [Oribacterium sp. WCC10]|uniref:HD-GYP domain-containing protein n=1 Tax=Oribacterium sp. WCC10 TaxID=1855343 RepID=UPI0008E3B35E|nr:HD-GYP domain-containing protein [Oribacterium sp. WCC10]SFG16040.1 HD domain-containing protein [Oribacterium sp. WCC10]
MKKIMDRKRSARVFAGALVAALLCLLLSIVKTQSYNSIIHNDIYMCSELGMTDGSKNRDRDVSVTAVPRNSTWTKAFDLYNEGITEHNYQAYTYDVTVMNNTGDEISDFAMKLVFSKEAFLASAWNGALEVHQHVDGKEIVDTVADMREFVKEDHIFDTVTFDGETFLYMKPGDYIVYIPSSSMNAMEMPIKPFEGTTPGFIMYIAIGESLNDSTLEIRYRFHRMLTSEPLFWIAIAGMVIWLISLGNYAFITAEIKKYNERHERDNKIINESIETFTGFIDAKDPYTNGHSKRVAGYTKLIAEEMGFEGEELDRIYYVALLHDCGKIGVPDSILRKPGRLTDEEFEIIKAHTVNGGSILSSFKSLENAGEGAMYHHERYDGKGYPEGRTGEKIPLIARIICVADSFDAMNTNRVYRHRLTKERIISEIENNKGRQFDPDIADIMLRLLSENKIVIDEN